MSDRNESQSANGKMGAAYERHVLQHYSARGWTLLKSNWIHPSGISVDLRLHHVVHGELWVECKSSRSSEQPGLVRSGTAKNVLEAMKTICDYHDLHGGIRYLYVVATTHPHRPRSRHGSRIQQAIEAGRMDVVVIPFDYEDRPAQLEMRLA